MTADPSYARAERNDVGENAALLPKRRRTRKKTPLPKLQLGVIMLTQLAEPISHASILPFINQMIGEFPITGGDPANIGYYVGLMVSLFFVTEACTVLYWSRLSDRIGRKPVLLIGLFGISLSMLLVGFSKSFAMLVLSRMLCGALNGNTGVAKSVTGELTDNTNVAQAFALMPITWAAGITIAPLMGGLLQHPADRFPRHFDTPFWRMYPYLLPCLVAAVFSLFTMIVTFFCFKETLNAEPTPKARPEHRRTLTTDSTMSTVSVVSTASTIPVSATMGNMVLQNVVGGNPLGAPTLGQSEPPYYSHSAPRTSGQHDTNSDPDAPLPLMELIRSPGVAVSITNYALLAILDIAFGSLNPLVLASPVLLGGLGFDPPTIGMIMGTWGLLNGVFQATCFTLILDRLGARRTFLLGIVCFVPIFACFPWMNAVARMIRFGEPDERPGAWVVWAVVGLQTSLVTIMDVSFGTIMIYIREASPNKRSLGATNGIAQLLASIVRAIGPTVATSMYAFSVSHNLLRGYAVYAVLVVLSALGVRLALMLPKDREEDDGHDS